MKELTLENVMRELHALGNIALGLRLRLNELRDTRFSQRYAREIDEAIAATQDMTERMRAMMLWHLRPSELRADRRVERTPGVAVRVPPSHILWVDDDALQLRALARFLSERGLRVTIAHTSAEALEKLENDVFDGYILDLMLPPGPLDAFDAAGGRLTGLSLAREIRQRDPGAPVMFVSIAPGDEMRRWCDDNPPAAWVPKSELFGNGAQWIADFFDSGMLGLPPSLIRVLLRFPGVVRDLARRHDARPALAMDDEYDVQDLLFALLRLVVHDDVRPEEWAPSVAGSASRIDFILPAFHLALEVKVTRASTRVSSIGNQIIVDAARYQSHPEVHRLCAFIYDPHHRITNTRAFAADLERGGRVGIPLHVIVGQ